MVPNMPSPSCLGWVLLVGKADAIVEVGKAKGFAQEDKKRFGVTMFSLS